MAAPLSLVSKYFTSEQRTNLAVTLSENLDSDPENPIVLCDLINDLEPRVFDQIYPNVLKYVENVTTSGNEKDFPGTLQIIKQSDRLCADVLGSILTQLKRCFTNRFNFVSAFQDQVEKLAEHNLEDVSKELVLSLFEFLTQLFSSLEVAVPPNTDRIICLFLGHKEEEIAFACSKLILWRIELIVDDTEVWDTVFGLESTGITKRHRSNAYILWLRILNCPKGDFKNNTHFQNNVINQDFYWKLLQKGMAGKLHEARKFCLSILQLSLKSINSSFQTEILTWDTKNSSRLIKEWSRFTTLFEILGIDTSLHQTQAAVNDILGLITPESLIHPSWGFCLLCTGFQAAMDSVRRYSAHILLSIKPESLHLIKYGLPYFEGTFLPYLMLSTHFAVRSTDGSTNEMECEYGDKLCDFLCHTLKSLKTQEEYSSVSLSILHVLDNMKESFDAVRFYATLGMVRGLQNQKVLEYGKHDHLILKLLDNFSEGNLFKTAIQTLNLRLILSFKLDSLANLGTIVTKFVKFNKYDIFWDNLAHVLDYLTSCGVSFGDIMELLHQDIPEDEKILLACFGAKVSDCDIQVLESFIAEQTETFLGKLVESGVNVSQISSGLEVKVQMLYQHALSGSADEQIYESLSTIESTAGSYSIDKLWTAITAGFVSDNYSVLLGTLSKFKMLNTFVDVFGFGDVKIQLNSILEFKESICSNSAECVKTVSNFYKFREDAFGEYHRFVALYVSKNGVDQVEFKQVLGNLNFGSTHFVTLYSICTIMKDCFELEVVPSEALQTCILGLCESWAELDADRLKLNEKELHTLFLLVIFHPFVLSNAVKSAILNEALLAIGDSVLFNSYGRRGLLTCMAKSLVDFQVLNPELFERLTFLPQLLVRAICQRQLQTSTFRIEEIIAKSYDKYLSPKKNSNIYEEIYGVEEVAARVWLFAIVNSVKTQKFAVAILDYIFDREDLTHFFKVSKKADGLEEYFRSQKAKIVLSVIDKVDLDVSIELYFDHLIHFIENDPSPLVRVYFEWIIAGHILKRPELSSTIFDKLVASLESHEAKPILVTIYERILYLMIQSLDRETEIEYLTKLLTIIIPAASTNKAVTRHFSMSLATAVYVEIRKKSLNIDDNLKKMVDNMYKSALAQDAFGQFRSGDALLWNIVEDLNLTSISGGLLLRLNDREVDFITKEEFEKYLSEKQVQRLNHPVGENRPELWVRELKAQKNRILQESSQISESPLQTKSGAWSTVMDVDESARGSDIVRSDLIVIASLVDKPPNLGGICRLCDVLGAGLMTIHDAKIKEHPQFKSVAVTADFWMPMAEVKPEQIVDFLKEKKAEGYELIGLEQTDKSVVLDKDLKFPKKSVILLGREKEGIPGELLAELDLCVEIKQVGVVRSMNIQTATAVIVHAYSAQNC